ncbi:hypothetical protein C2845_PM01G46500 [Panicum miliaceum]|uniref:Aminotransferase-like plant mobile domain-containing protein n=1 Tax=Panicum miliaceum TaxID=4540 RepID=A0A3L6TTT3_PANMI|nr:hypothetical protein C2845_PM01G46500 [Panicum miliaceum]
MVLGLPLEGNAATRIIRTGGWRDMVEANIGIRPPAPPEGVKDRKTSGVSSAWLRKHFNHCPAGADGVAVERHAQDWLWHLFGGFIFPGGSGNTISWMTLPIIGQQWEMIGTYSWGSVALGWMYRQLCDACRHVGSDANLGGCAYLLQIWIWERFPVGRPYRGPIEAWPHADAESRPIVAFCGKNVGALHLPHRVKRQFSRLQDFPPEHISTSQALHNIDRKKRYSQTDWRVKHVAWLLQWEQRQRMEPTSGAVHRNNHYKEYLRWFYLVAGVSIKPPRSNVPIEERADIDDEDDIVDEYNDITRARVQPERAPLENYVAQQLARLANKAGVAMAHASGGENGGGHLRAFAERVRRSCKRMAAKLNCIVAPNDQFVQLAARAGASSARHTSSSMRTPYHYGQGTITTPSRSISRTGSRAASKGKAASSHHCLSCA